MDNPYFQHEFSAGSDPKLDKVQMYLKCEGYGLYWHITEMLYREKGKIALSEIPYIAQKYSVSEEFVNKLLNLPVGAGKTLFQRDKDFFWSDSVNKRLKDIEERSERGRRNAQIRWERENLRELPKQEFLKIPDCELVNLTSAQYKKLSGKYSEEKLLKGISILQSWLEKGSKKAREYIGKPHYGHFRSDSWLWGRVDEIIRKENHVSSSEFGKY